MTEDLDSAAEPAAPQLSRAVVTPYRECFGCHMEDTGFKERFADQRCDLRPIIPDSSSRSSRVVERV